MINFYEIHDTITIFSLISRLNLLNINNLYKQQNLTEWRDLETDSKTTIFCEMTICEMNMNDG